MTQIAENRNYDNRTREAILRVLKIYGEQCESVGHAFLQHGRTLAILPPAGVWHQVWQVQGLEVLPTSNVIDTIYSAGADTNLLEIEGLTVDGGNFTRVVQTKALNGLNDVAIDTPLARVVSIKNVDSTVLTAQAFIKRSDNDAIHAKALDGESGSNRSLKAVYTAAQNEYLCITQLVTAMVINGMQNPFVSLEVREPGGLWQEVVRTHAHTFNPFSKTKFNPMIIVPPNSDVRLVTQTVAANMAVDAWMNGLILTKV